jgi:hypothetical protein
MPSTGGSGGNISGGQELIQVQQSSASLGRLLGRMITGINQLAKNTAASPTGETSAPTAPNALSVTTMGEYVHASITHNGQLQRGIQYALHVGVDDPKFNQPLVVDMGSSRTSHPFPLPTLMSDGKTPHQYFFRAVAQYQASQPSPYTTAGGASSPTAFTLSGTTAGTLLPSNGSGTSPANGQAPGFLGKTQTRTGN